MTSTSCFVIKHRGAMKNAVKNASSESLSPNIICNGQSIAGRDVPQCVNGISGAIDTTTRARVIFERALTLNEFEDR